MISVIESQATLKEELFFRKQDKLEKQKQKDALEKANNATAITQTEST